MSNKVSEMEDAIGPRELAELAPDYIERKPPICPKCKKPLLYVKETAYAEYRFEEDQYEEAGYSCTDEWGEQSETTCGNCGADVSHLFPEGVCNH